MQYDQSMTFHYGPPINIVLGLMNVAALSLTMIYGDNGDGMHMAIVVGTSFASGWCLAIGIVSYVDQRLARK